MANKIIKLLYNGIRFIGNPACSNLLAVEPSTRISKSAGAILKIGKKFRARHNIEINVRDKAIIEIGNDVFLNSGCMITAREKVVIGDNTIFGPNVVVYDNDHLIRDGKILDNEFETEPVIIGANVWIGAGTIILKGTIIEDNCVVAAGSIVKGKIESNNMIIQKRDTESRPIRGGVWRKIKMKFKILIKVLLTKFYVAFPRLISDEAHSKLLFRVMFGYTPDLEHPRTMNEYICATKVSDAKLRYDIYTDKYEVRDYVRKTVGDQYLNEVIGIYDSFDEIDFDKMPDAFAMKATHGSSYNIIVPDNSKLDRAAAKKKFDRWLKENFYYKDREKNYKNIKPRIMCDAFLRPLDGQLEEYKVFCFKGKTGFIQHNKQIGGRRYDNIFDAQWSILPAKYGYDGFTGDRKPENGDELIAVAEKLAAPFELVRVDLYNVDGRIVFSELTFHSGGGLIPFEPKEYDREFGKMLGL